ncbi:hypothetical protein BAUCODRAFT_549308 [Baudoinia panamericana UAMH 10762]|uniref:Uncharacterized protein n=1 Tax=Baudoinia panamericana (strain UAMH 10762) TaxID=717646 RepID=M2N621_BAUPA|nr:uncharacterized protein BAUCODRAFT_549308 [Baudoinia panamericana UAMH 10762]EMC94479.1 hypothetical protein BAUCODRAFT_549308 [Baudoinia panamericana UAMH 10762]
MKEVLRLTAELDSSTNELHSLQKEAETAQAENITLMLARDKALALPQAVREVVGLMQGCHERFDTLKGELKVEMCGQYPKTKLYIVCAKASVTGTVYWVKDDMSFWLRLTLTLTVSYHCQRYFP